MKALLLPLLVAGLACTRNTPSWSPVEPGSTLTILGEAPGITMARARLGSSETFRFQASPCQEVLVLVEQGVVRASLTWLETGRAARFRTPATIQAMSPHGAELFVVGVLFEGAPFDVIDWTNAPDDPVCPRTDQRVVLSDPARSGPFTRSRGALRATIYLEGSRAVPALASLGALAGEPTLVIPEHDHHQSAEVLWIERGSGTMRVGAETVPVGPDTFVFVPPLTAHGFVPDGTGPIFAYQVYLPSGPEQRFRGGVDSGRLGQVR